MEHHQTNRIPIFLTKGHNTHNIPNLPRHKYLVNDNISLGELIWNIRCQLNLSPEKVLFIFVNNTLPNTTTLLSDLYSIHKSQDGALRMTYTSEHTFGFNPYACAYSYASLLSLQHRPSILFPL